MIDESPEVLKLTSHHMLAPNGYSLWEFSGHRWDLRKDASIAGGVPGKPPRGPGLFAGQIRAVPSIAQ